MKKGLLSGIFFLATTAFLMVGLYGVGGWAKKAIPKAVELKAKFGNVHFNHSNHVKKYKIKCVTCHHKMKTNPSKMACRDCHKKPKVGNAPVPMKAFHKTCKGCHKKKGGPTSCKACHKK